MTLAPESPPEARLSEQPTDHPILDTTLDALRVAGGDRFDIIDTTRSSKQKARERTTTCHAETIPRRAVSPTGQRVALELSRLSSLPTVPMSPLEGAATPQTTLHQPHSADARRSGVH